MTEKFCTSCGSQRQDNTKFCTSCGYQFSNSSNIPSFSFNQDFRTSMDSSFPRIKNLLTDMTGEYFRYDVKSQDLNDKLDINKDPNAPKIKVSVMQPSNYDNYTNFLLNFHNQIYQALGQSNEKSEEQLVSLLESFLELSELAEITQTQVKALALSAANMASMKALTYDQGQILLNLTDRFFHLLEDGKHSYHPVAFAYYFLLYHQYIPDDQHLILFDKLEHMYYEKPMSNIQADIALQIINHYYEAKHLSNELAIKVKEFTEKSRGGEVITFIQLAQIEYYFRQMVAQSRFGQRPQEGFISTINNFNQIWGLIVNGANKFSNHEVLGPLLGKVATHLTNLATVDGNQQLLEACNQLKTSLNVST